MREDWLTFSFKAIDMIAIKVFRVGATHTKTITGYAIITYEVYIK